jgi:dTDP-4-dehydrorhamnose reductase
MKVAVLGVSGMLGSMVLDCFASDASFKLLATARSQELIQRFQPDISNVEWRLLDAELCNVAEISNVLGDARWVVNAIGIIKHRIHDDNAVEVARAIRVNALFPHLLAQAAEKTGCRVLQIATDCVYSGSRGHYTETDNHDALDVYGKTKSLGEVFSSRVCHLRCSIIGPEPKGHVSLMDWLLHQAHNSNVNGYTNHLWNGLTTWHFARICLGVIKRDIELPQVQHIVPDGTISKAELLQYLAREYHREDIKITHIEAKTMTDRTLDTVDKSLNKILWEAAGYKDLPSIPRMVEELAKFRYRFALENVR